MLSEFAQRMVDVGGFEGVFFLSLAMIMGHALGDYPMQGSFLAACKNRNADTSVFFGSSRVPKGLWIHGLTAHSLIQAGIVWIVTGSAVVMLVELVVHWITDFIRCEEWISFTTDQIIHVSCKVGFALLLVWRIV